MHIYHWDHGKTSANSNRIGLPSYEYGPNNHVLVQICLQTGDPGSIYLNISKKILVLFGIPEPYTQIENGLLH